MKPTKEDYKQTEVGLLPEDWEVVGLGDIVTYQKGKAPRTTLAERGRNTSPYLTAESLRRGAFAKWAEESSELVKVNKDDLVLIWDGYYCGDIFTGLEGVLSSTMVKIEPKGLNLDKHFIFYFLKTCFKELNTKISGMYLKHVNKHVFDSVKVPLPPVPEQKKIAGVLSTVDEGIGKVDEAIQKTERLKKGLMQQLFTKGIGHKEFKDVEMGRIPKAWKVVKLGEILSLCQYGLSIKMQDKGRYAIVKMDDVLNGYVVPDNVKYVDLDERTFRDYKLEKGDILFNRTNSYELVGRTGIFVLEGSYVFASYLIRLGPDHGIVDSPFLTFYLIFSSERLRKLATRAVHQANINATNLQKFKLALPPILEQRKIAEILNAVDRRLELLREKKEKLSRLKKGLMNDLLTGKVRVKVVA